VALFYVMLAGNILIITILSYLAVLRTRTRSACVPGAGRVADAAWAPRLPLGPPVFLARRWLASPTIRLVEHDGAPFPGSSSQFRQSVYGPTPGPPLGFHEMTSFESLGGTLGEPDGSRATQHTVPTLGIRWDVAASPPVRTALTLARAGGARSEC